MEVESATGCNASPYHWGDDVIYVCANDLPVTDVSGEGLIQAGNFSFVNYRTGPWNNIATVCFKSVGASPLDESVESLTFDVVSWQFTRIEVKGPWPSDGKVCVDVDMTIGPTDQATVMIGLNLLYPFTNGDEYKFEVTSSSDVTIADGSGWDQSQPIVGDFPVQAPTVTVVGY